MFKKKIGFIFRNGRKSRIDLQKKFPSEFFYGYLELKKKKYNVSIIEDSDIQLSPPLSFMPRYLNKLSRLISNVPIGMAIPLFKKKNKIILNSYDFIVATSNGIGIALCLGKALGLLKCKIIFLTMGILNLKSNFFDLLIYKFILKYSRVVSLGLNEQVFVNKKLNLKVYYLPFGVDKDFWTTQKVHHHNESYVFSIGNDLNRDWKTLIESWDKKFPKLKIVTSHKISSDKKNIEIIDGDWRSLKLSDEAIKKLYQNAMFVVLPLKNTIQPAGQSACLQAMSCEKLVVISNIEGIWDKNKLIDNKNIIFVDPENSKKLNSKLCYIINNHKLIKSVGLNARKLVKEHYNTDIMAQELYKIIKQ